MTDLRLGVIAIDLGGERQQLLRTHVVGIGAEPQGAAQLGSPRAGAALILHPRTRTPHTTLDTVPTDNDACFVLTSAGEDGEEKSAAADFGPRHQSALAVERPTLLILVGLAMPFAPPVQINQLA